MKTFEERYTAWIDGQLAGPALTAFEQELARRAAAGDADADRTDTLRLRRLLRDHLEAPVLNNPEFFSHQLRERLDAERGPAASRGREAAATTGGGGFFSFLPWSVGRLVLGGAACLFVAGALYYGLEPGAPKVSGGQGNVAVAQATPAPETAAPVEQSAPRRDPSEAPQYAKLAAPTPEPLDSPDIQVKEATPASATALRYQKPDVDVIWTGGLDYLPDVPGAANPPPAADAPLPSAAP